MTANRSQGSRVAFFGMLVAAFAIMLGSSVRAQEPAAEPGAEYAVKSDLADENLLLAVADTGERLVAVGAFGHVILSDDKGQTWRQAESVPTRVTLTTVFFTNDQVGYAAGHDTVIIKTEDGGENWRLLYNDPEAEEPVFTMFFDSPSHGLVMGAFSLVMETQDGGETWERRPLDPDSEDDFHLNGLFRTADGNYLVAAEFGTVYRSTDNGARFEAIQTEYEGSFWGGIALKDGSLLIYGMRGNVYRSTNKGSTWQQVDTGSDKSFSSAVQLANGDVVLVGLSGAVGYSTDGGKSFKTYNRPDRLGYAAIAEGPDGNVVLFGEPGVKIQPATLPSGS